jgi:hypothetical protein
MKRLKIILLFICFPAIFFGQDIKVTAKFDTNRIYIGDQIYFTVRIEKPVETEILVATFKDTLYKKIEIISGPLLDTVALQNGRNALINKYLITAFDSGLYQVPPVYAELVSTNESIRYYSNYTSLVVSRVNLAPQDTTDVIYDIVKPYKAPLTIGDILPWFLLLVVISLIIWYLLRFLKNRKKIEPETDNNVVYEPAHIIAFRELEKLKNDNLWQNGEVKLYYTRLTEILRSYLENRYRITSMELTTDETLRIYKKTIKPDVNHYNSLKSILTDADLVKFAKFKPESADNEISYDNSWNFVSETMLKPEIVESETEEKEKNKTAEGKK